MNLQELRKLAEGLQACGDTVMILRLEKVIAMCDLIAQCKEALADIIRNHGEEVWGHGGEEALAAIEQWEKK